MVQCLPHIRHVFHGANEVSRCAIHITVYSSVGADHKSQWQFIGPKRVLFNLPQVLGYKDTYYNKRLRANRKIAIERYRKSIYYALPGLLIIPNLLRIAPHNLASASIPYRTTYI
jgi:hypothetical protein